MGRQMMGGKQAANALGTFSLFCLDGKAVQQKVCKVRSCSLSSTSLPYYDTY